MSCEHCGKRIRKGDGFVLRIYHEACYIEFLKKQGVEPTRLKESLESALRELPILRSACQKKEVAEFYSAKKGEKENAISDKDFRTPDTKRVRKLRLPTKRIIEKA